MTDANKQFAWQFVQLCTSAFILFVLSAMLGTSFVGLVRHMNDSATTKSLAEWLAFWIGAPLTTALWATVWIWFKKSEKRCLELYQNRSE